MTRSPSISLTTTSRTPLRGWDRKAVLVVLAYLALYVLLHWLSDIRPMLQLGITPWNPQAGLTLAFLVVFGPRWLPATAAAALLAELGVRASATGTLSAVIASMWIATAYAALAVALRRTGLGEPIRTSMAAARFAGLAVAGTFVVAAGFIGVYLVAGALPLGDAMVGITRYWVGDLHGVLTLTPLFLQAAASRGQWHLVRKHGWELTAQLAVVLLTVGMIFRLPADDQLRFFYLLFVPVIWIALRWKWQGAMLAVLVIQIGLVLASRTAGPTPRFIDLQFLMLTLSLTGLLLGAVVAERAGFLEQVALREAEQRALLTMAPDAVLTVDTSGTIRMANPAALRLFGAHANPEHRRQLTTLLPGLDLTKPEGRASLDGRSEDGSIFPAEIAWARLDAPASEAFLVTVRDATDRKRAQEQLRERDAALARAMRFAVAGELASALTHELNQPITALVSYLRAGEILATRPQNEEDRLKGTLSKAAQEAIRASEVLRRLRDFYRGGARKRETVHIASVCNSVVQTFEDRLRRSGASLSVTVDPSLPEIEGDSTQLEIALHNLLANAIDAVTQTPRAVRQIALRAARREGAVLLEVEDSGPGIATDVAQKLFEPFVTSKPDGMGLGLAISRSLIRARGGDLSFARSHTLGGAVFSIRLPIENPPDTHLL